MGVPWPQLEWHGLSGCGMSSVHVYRPKCVLNVLSQCGMALVGCLECAMALVNVAWPQ